MALFPVTLKMDFGTSGNAQNDLMPIEIPTDRLSALPAKLQDRIFSYLNKWDLQAVMRTNWTLRVRVLTIVTPNPELVSNFIGIVIQKLNEKDFSDQRNLLRDISQNIAEKTFKNVQEQAKYLLPVKTTLSGVIQLLDMETTNGLKDNALHRFMKDVFELAAFERKIDIARRIPDKSGKSSVLRDICHAMARAGYIARATSVAKLIPDEFAKHFAFADISKALAEARDFENAIEVAKLIPNLAPCKPKSIYALQKIPEFISLEDNALRDISTVLADNSNFKEAIKVAHLICNNLHRSIALLYISAVMAKTEYIDEAIVLYKLISNKSEKIAALVCICEALAKAGDIERAIYFAKLIPDDFSRNPAFAAISRVLAEAGNIDGAIEVIKLISHHVDMNNAFVAISRILIRAENIDGAIDVADLISYRRMRDTAYGDISSALINVGNIDKAIFAAKLITNEFDRKTAFEYISRTSQRKLGMLTKLSPLLS